MYQTDPRLRADCICNSRLLNFKEHTKVAEEKREEKEEQQTYGLL